MKKILILTNALLLIVTLFLCYKLYSIKTGIFSNTIGGPKKTCADQICKDYTNSPWKGRINGYLAKKLAENYEADQGKYFIWNGDQITKEADARSAWFPLEVLKRYIWEIENKSCEKNCTDTLGMRIYYARYPDPQSELWTGFGLELMTNYANHHTLFMVPTYWDKVSQLNKDFDPWAGCRKPIDTLPSSKSFVLFTMSGSSDDAQNHGSLIPPDNRSASAF